MKRRRGLRQGTDAVRSGLEGGGDDGGRRKRDDGRWKERCGMPRRIWRRDELLHQLTVLFPSRVGRLPRILPHVTSRTIQKAWSRHVSRSPFSCPLPRRHRTHSNKHRPGSRPTRQCRHYLSSACSCQCLHCTRNSKAHVLYIKSTSYLRPMADRHSQVDSCLTVRVSDRKL